MRFMEPNVMNQLLSYKIRCLIPLFLPWIFSEFLSFEPVISFFFAWLAGIFLCFYSINGPLKQICTDQDLRLHVMRPMILIQLIFVGLMSGTSIFYFLNHLGYYFWENQGMQDFVPNEETFLLAACQRLYLFAHASLLLGMMLKLKRGVEIRYTLVGDPDQFLIPGLLISIVVMLIFSHVPALNQIAVILIPVPKIIAAVVSLKGLREKRPVLILLGALLFLYSLYQATTTGYKEATFVHLIILGFVFYPHYKTLVIGLAFPVILTLLYILPSWNNTVRSEEWMVQGVSEEAKTKALEIVLQDDNDELLRSDSWEFLVNRFSEINMFSKFLTRVPDRHPYYGTEIVGNAIYALVPRFLWPEKPNTEMQSMERVYEAEIVSRTSAASAKTRPVVDGYLSAGHIGIFILMVGYGMSCQALANLAESLFGGYQMGCVIIFNGLFQQLWRGNNLEFILNNVLYGLIIMLLLFYILKYSGLIIRYSKSI